MLGSLVTDRSLRPMGVYATVSRAPSDADDTLDVLWTSASDGVEPEGQGEETDLRWASRGGVLPDVGDDALLFIDSRGDPWAVCWPSGATPDTGPEAITMVAAFSNGWLNYDSDRAAGYYRDQGRVYLTGVIKSGTVGSTAFTLPSGYRPRVTGAQQLIFATDSNNAHGSLFIYQDGRVVPAVGSNVYFGLEVNFRHA